MRYIIYTIGLIWAMAWGYEFKHVKAQAQSATPLEIADANMLPSMKPTMATIRAKRVWGADLQFEYYWKPGSPSGTRTQEFIFKRYIVLGVTSSGGYWTTPKVFIDAENVLNMDSLNKVRGFLQGPGWKARADADSVRLVNEVARATAAESNLQPKGTYLTTESDPLYTANGVPRTRTVNTKPLSADVVLTTTDVAEGTNQYFTTARALTAVAGAGYVKNVIFGGGVTSFNIPITLLGGQNMTVTVPLNVTFPDNTYVLNQPLFLGTGGINLMSNTITLVSIVKNPSNVVFTIKNNTLLSVAVTATAEVSALKVVQ